MKILICDDDAFTIKIIQKLLTDAGQKEGVRTEIVCLAESPAELLQYIRKNPGEYAIFLDLDLGQGQMNGIDLAAKVRHLLESAKIIFITSHSEKTLDILKSGVEPFGYIEKDLNQGLMLRDIRAALRKLKEAQSEVQSDDTCENSREDSGTLQVPVGIDEYVSVPYGQILYIDTNKSIAHNVSIHLVGGSVLNMRATISDISKLIDDRFCQCHRSVLVNTAHVVKAGAASLTLSNGESVPMSLAGRSSFRKKTEV